MFTAQLTALWKKKVCCFVLCLEPSEEVCGPRLSVACLGLFAQWQCDTWTSSVNVSTPSGFCTQSPVAWSYRSAPAQQRAPAMATYGGVSINKHLGLSPVTRAPQLTHTHTHTHTHTRTLCHTVTAVSSGRGCADTIGENRESLGLVYCSWEGSPLSNTLFKFGFRHLALNQMPEMKKRAGKESASCC